MPAMPAVDYYDLLGLQPGANVDELREAWRRLAARWHPDRAGKSATGIFQQLSAAYAVLSDPIARAAYDRRCGHPPPRPAAAAPATPAATPVRGPGPARRAAPGVMLSRLCGALNTLLACGVARFEEPGFITLVLREAEAAQGGMATISMRVDLWCPQCTAKKRPPAGCARCGGAGRVQELYSAWLAVPPGIASGQELAPSVGLPGMIESMRFRIRVLSGGC
jgi:molecular chaperone DnaJ